jgi:hypothetical protein
VKLTIHLHVVPRLRLSGAIPSPVCFHGATFALTTQLYCRVEGERTHSFVKFRVANGSFGCVAGSLFKFGHLRVFCQVVRVFSDDFMKVLATLAVMFTCWRLATARAFGHVRRVAETVSLYLFVIPSSWNNSAAAERIVVQFDNGGFTKTCRENRSPAKTG